MARDPTELSIVQIEKRLLRAMCQPGAGANIGKMASGALRTYHWREPVHEVLFEAVSDLGARKPTLLRELLPAALARRGYPDVAYDEFFEPGTLTDEEARELVRRLLDAEPGA
jgi:hypothetical protein